MKFEKLSDNKIRIILTVQDLTEKHIDFHSFMANTIESQDILLDMLEEAKLETGFDPEDANLRIEALAMADTSFIFTITKENEEAPKKISGKKKFTVKRKSVSTLSSTQAVYEFYSFEDFCNLLQFLHKSNLFYFAKLMADSVELYYYKDNYYLLMSNIHSEIIDKIRFYTAITEFAKYATNSKVFASKLKECGNLVMKDNAFEIGFEHFVAPKLK